MGYRLRLPRGFYPWSSVRSGAIARDRDRVGHRLDLPMRPPPRECVRETAIEQLGERKRAFRLLILVGQPATEREGGDRLAGIECRGLNTDHRFIPPIVHGQYGSTRSRQRTSGPANALQHRHRDRPLRSVPPFRCRRRTLTKPIGLGLLERLQRSRGGSPVHRDRGDPREGVDAGIPVSGCPDPLVRAEARVG